MKLCVLQGTFNPIHKAHLLMAEYALKNFAIDKVIFIPAARPPHKIYDENFSIHRYNMTKIATQSYKNFFTSDIEYKFNGKSYTYLTILKLYDLYNIEGKINFIIGSDAFEKIESWYETDKLKKLVDFIVFMRENNYSEKKFEKLKNSGYNFKIAKMNFIDISSTEIRERIKQNQDISQYVPDKTKEYIEKNGLYRN